jgi:hypothetical protein
MRLGVRVGEYVHSGAAVQAPSAARAMSAAAANEGPMVAFLKRLKISGASVADWGATQKGGAAFEGGDAALEHHQADCSARAALPRMTSIW